MSEEARPDWPTDSLDITPEMAVEEAMRDLRQCRDARNSPTKALVIFPWDDEGDYRTHFINAGMKTSEMIALHAIATSRLHKMMDDDAEEA